MLICRAAEAGDESTTDTDSAQDSQGGRRCRWVGKLGEAVRIASVTAFLPTHDPSERVNSMSESGPPEGPADSDAPGGEPPAQHLRARVPDHVAGGTFSTGAIVITGPSEFVLDFLQTIGRPHRVAARVIIGHQVMPQFIEALRTNLQLYQQRFGPPPTPPKPSGEVRRPTPQEIYDDLKLPDEILSGVYANGVMIGHGPSEFGFDFLTSFFPQSAVSCRVFLAAGQVPRLLESLQNAVQQLRQRQPPPGGAAEQPGAADEAGGATPGRPGDQPPPPHQPPGDLPPDNPPPPQDLGNNGGPGPLPPPGEP